MQENEITTGLLIMLWKKYVLGRAGALPAAVRGVRAMLEVGLIAAVGAAWVFLGTQSWGDLAPFQGVAFLVAQAIEALIDQFVDPTQNRRSLHR